MDPLPIDDVTPRTSVRPPASAGLETLLSNIVDYAGLFPPAKLDMKSTVANYAAYLAHDDAWMLERLIVPVARLDEFEEHATGLLPHGEDDEPWPISALTAAADDENTEKLEADLDRIATFNAAHAEAADGRAAVETIELKAATPAAIDHALDLVGEDLFPFFELSTAGDPRGLIATLAGGDAGAKIRTGGVTADLYPSPESVARFIAGCAASGVPFKATAGLHHPLRHRAETPAVQEFGFLNIFVAGILAFYDRLEPSELLALLRAESIDAFAFDDTGLEWAGHRLDLEEIDDARLSFAISFGCCSFDDPRQELTKLGLLRS